MLLYSVRLLGTNAGELLVEHPDRASARWYRKLDVLEQGRALGSKRRIERQESAHVLGARLADRTCLLDPGDRGEIGTAIAEHQRGARYRRRPIDARDAVHQHGTATSVLHRAHHLFKRPHLAPSEFAPKSFALGARGRVLERI